MIMRVIRAFFQALAMTLRGESVPAPAPVVPLSERAPEAAAWLAKTLVLVAEVEAAAQAIDLEALTVRVDKRDVRASTILKTIRFHAEQEYPYLLNNPTSYSGMGIQAINLNDCHLISQLVQSGDMPDALVALNAHLEAIPRGVLP